MAIIEPWQQAAQYYFNSAQAQQNVPPLPAGYSDYYRKPREMTHEDLGLDSFRIALLSNWYARAQNKMWKDHKRRWHCDAPYREMTREDLGLPLQYDGRWTDFTMAQFEQWADLTAPRTDAPYAFWLGAAA